MKYHTANAIQTNTVESPLAVGKTIKYQIVTFIQT